MLQTPSFRAAFRVRVVRPEGVYLISEQDSFVLKGEKNCAIADLIEGRRTTDEIVDALQKTYSPAEIYFTLERLAQKGYLVEAEGQEDKPLVAFWEAAGADAAATTRRLGECSVGLIGCGDVDVESLRAALERTGLAGEIEDGGSSSPDLAIVLTDDYLRPELADLNLRFRAAGWPWLLAKPAGMFVWRGPLFTPATGCWQCLAHRLSRNREVEGFVLRRLGSGEPVVVSFAATRATLALAHGWIAAQVALILGRQMHRDNGDAADAEILTLNLLEMETARHALIRRPHCAVCGDPPDLDRIPERPELLPGIKHFVSDGGDRVRRNISVKY